ncbi:omega-amidase NIT2-like [Liolophura sinensis]|uniref:omega-amidase NIT2-like n=1 Tax=Liolophura sinensis TaxID=3198878 RepID=UPI00315820EA
MGSKFRLALVQMSVVLSKSENISHATRLVGEAAAKGANMVALPELFVTPCSPGLMKKAAEPLMGETIQALREAARKSRIYLIGGTIVEQEGEKRYNTCNVIDPEGELIASYRKLHAFDVDLPPNLRIVESETFARGYRLTTFDTPICRVGLSICYDIRFPEMTLLYGQKGCKLVFMAGAFNNVTGPAHWEAILRTRAVDQQMYIAAASPARDLKSPYVTWGHSMIVNPWGEILAQAEFDEEIIMADIDMKVLETVRRQMPLYAHKRNDVYRTDDISPKQ